MSSSIMLDGRSLSIAEVIAVARQRASVAIAPAALVQVATSRRAVEAALARGDTMYGVTTGFGKLAHVRIPADQLGQLQRNLIRSHASGVGEPLAVDAVRAMMLLRANVLLQGTSGVRAVLPQLIVTMLNQGVHPVVPSQGSVGASGDLAPLSHLALAMIGEGEDGARMRAAGLQPVTLEAKEGLAFVNGTQAQTGLAALLVHDAWVLWRTAHAAAAMSLEAVRGTPVPFDPRIHDARPHPWQPRSAALLRDLLADSEIRESHRAGDPRVQDAYSLRCTPQVLGAVGEGLAFAERLIATELNAATDNPLVFDGEVLSGGNFHGQPIALALDVIGIGLATLAGLSERRAWRARSRSRRARGRSAARGNCPPRALRHRTRADCRSRRSARSQSAARRRPSLRPRRRAPAACSAMSRRPGLWGRQYGVIRGSPSPRGGRAAAPPSAAGTGGGGRRGSGRRTARASPAPPRGSSQPPHGRCATAPRHRAPAGPRAPSVPGCR